MLRVRACCHWSERKREMQVHATLSPSFSLFLPLSPSFSLFLPLSLSLSDVNRVRTPLHLSEREREGKRERERRREFLKGMTGALAPFIYLVSLCFAATMSAKDPRDFG
jgi:hypothetical protein